MSFVNSHTALALAEGFGLAFSPCILPILPFILAASAVGNRWRPFVIIAGFVASFTAFSLLVRKIISFTGIGPDIIQYVAYGLLVLFGLTMVVPFLEKHFASLTGRLASDAQDFSSGARAEGFGGALLVGALIGIVWTPCAGPILAAALLQVIQAETNFAAATTMAAFSIGAAIPMLAIALFGQQLSHRVRALAKHATLIRRAMGAVIIAFAICGLLGFNIGAWSVQNGAAPETTASEGAALQQNAPQDAPEIGGIKQWFNSEPLTLASLKGKVVLVDFWTYSCINCIRTLPYIESWYEKYKDRGLVVIGVHSPEFPFEGEPENVAMAIKKFGLTYPVAMDNDFVTWKNYRNQYWPAHYLIDRDGRIVETHFGEGGYGETENDIRALVGLDKITATAPDAEISSPAQTPETYLGYQRAERFASPEALAADREQDYSFPRILPPHSWALHGAWTIGGQPIVAQRAGAGLRLNFTAAKVYLVMGSKSGQPVSATLKLNGAPIAGAAAKDAPGGVVTVDRQRLYELVDEPTPQSAVLEITADAPGLEAYAFTFGN